MKRTYIQRIHFKRKENKLNFFKHNNNNLLIFIDTHTSKCWDFTSSYL